MSNDNQRATPLAVQDCAHIMRRVARDANFRYLMLYTESLDLCTRAWCEHYGKSYEDTKTSILNAEIDDAAELPRLRDRVEELEREIAELRSVHL